MTYDDNTSGNKGHSSCKAKVVLPAITLAAEVALTSSQTCFAPSYPIAGDGLGQAGA